MLLSQLKKAISKVDKKELGCKDPKLYGYGESNFFLSCKSSKKVKNEFEKELEKIKPNKMFSDFPEDDIEEAGSNLVKSSTDYQEINIWAEEFDRYSFDW